MKWSPGISPGKESAGRSPQKLCYVSLIGRNLTSNWPHLNSDVGSQEEGILTELVSAVHDNCVAFQ